MTNKVGRNQNVTDTVNTTTVGINSTTSTTLLAANPDRLWAKVSLDVGGGQAGAFIRDYAAATDNNKAGELIFRTAQGAVSKYVTIVDNVYTGEISAISVSGTINVHVMEG